MNISFRDIELPVEKVGNEPSGVAATPKGSFDDALAKVDRALNQPQLEAGALVQEFVNGSEGNLHETLIALEKANISFRFASSVRNKLLEAYREVMRMEV